MRPSEPALKVLGVCGSLQATSSNLALLHAAERLAGDGVALELFEELGALPMFNPDLEAAGEIAVVLRWRSAIARSDAILIASPEYGHSLPGVLKNAIDWVIGSGELECKVVGLTASTSHPERGVLGLRAVAVTLGAVRAKIVGGLPTVRGPEFDSALRALLGDLRIAVGS